MNFYTLRNAALSVLLAALVAVFWILHPQSFGSSRNALLLFSQNTELAVLAMGMTLVVLTGGIDLSVAGNLAFTACVMGWFARTQGWGAPAVCSVGLAVGALGGLLNSVAVTRLRIPPIVATLATLYLFRGLARVITNDGAYGPFNTLPVFHAMNASEGLQGALLGGLIAAAMAWVATATALRALSAIGGNEAAARYSGISVDRMKTLAYTLAGLLCGVGAIFYLGRSPSAKANIVDGLELDVIAAVLLGGTRIQGGEGSLVGSLLGVAVLSVLKSGLSLSLLDAFWQMAIIGGIVILTAAGNEPLARGWARRGLRRTAPP